jgi:hypothetical protein
MKRTSKPKLWPFKSLTLKHVIEDFIDDRPGPEKSWNWTVSDNWQDKVGSDQADRESILVAQIRRKDEQFRLLAANSQAGRVCPCPLSD